MAVYTTLSKLQVNELILRFDLPALTSFEAVSSGIENTTYFLTLANTDQYVLTLFEMLNEAQLPPYIQLTAFLHNHQLPVPTPLADRYGMTLQHVAGKPAVLVPRVAGKHCNKPSRSECATVGAMLARLHLVGNQFPVSIPNPCDLFWAETTAAVLYPSFSKKDQELVDAQLASGRHLQSQPLPRGIIHGDLFRDNVLFEQRQISAIIDFYNAGNDILLLDVAVAINDWCFHADGSFDTANAETLIGAYQTLRPFTPIEQVFWQPCLQWAAFRFWLSRLKSIELHKHTGGVINKIPTEYRDRLLFHTQIQY